ncbi:MULTISPECIES: siderophore ABC transporter substrate-binding protein [unclassified Rhodococcus (in: high G+C Gram-positive bacteria)]|uniref:siderophore ABC transporter substrate-binding protein n=1 Tax=unclassified Rhodococcus (in: high G+C Gram-positive bacteria) TaxID=192944 RepID=UPI0007BBA037|nr:MULTISPECIES: ABC transporter substrate-binding protein [unclassified Rhodococcus (in: high G+C Gram-positive bacteria)]KZF00758.1 ABC transporter substrate-binding protein [Rhodococcus sp. EPR-279]KZF01937.1 ABC transporter substrate-binding protein [Rhodococcus sp. EPR-147]
MEYTEVRTFRVPHLLVAAAATSLLVLGACSTDSATGESTDAATVTIETNNGSMEVPANPVRVAALDNTSFETLRAFGIEPVALPKPIMPSTGFEEWIDNDAILDVGTHREPNLEVVSEAEPDLIIGGYRFQEYTDELGQIAPTIDISPDDENFVDTLKAQTETLGVIFDKEDRAAEIVAALDAAEASAAAQTTGQPVFLANVNGGKIDNGAARIGRLLEPLTLTDVFAGQAGDVHGDSGLAPETIAQANPDWVIVLDRDAAAGEPGSSPAKAVFDAQEAFADTTFTTEDQIIYLDPFFYTREGIQAYTEAFQSISDAFENAA